MSSPSDQAELPAFTNGTLTSWLAKEMMSKRIRSMQALKILEAVFEAGSRGLIRQEIERITGINGNSVRPRLLGLERLCLLERSPDQFRPTESGRLAEVWVIPEHLNQRLL